MKTLKAQAEEVSAEHTRTLTLLHEFLPKLVIDQLSSGFSVIADSHDDLTIVSTQLHVNVSPPQHDSGEI